MQGAIPTDKQFFKNLLIGLHTGSNENEIVRFQTNGFNSLKLPDFSNKTREIDFTPIPGTSYEAGPRSPDHPP